MSYLDRTDTFMSSLGLETYRVGGSVRDELLGRRVKDADYMVRGATLRDLGSVLRSREFHCDITVSKLSLRDGRQAGWRVSGRGLGMIEIVLPRKEVSTGPGHTDFEIVVDPALSLAEDAVRRDFTFNALYYRLDTIPETRIIHDPTGRGIYDLNHRLINVTHADSFRDDPLRTLRALRFISTLGYELGAETRALMALHADAVTGLSEKGYASGTVLDELGRLLMGQDPATALRVARDTGVLAVAFPELVPMLGFDQGSRYHDMTTDEHTFKALETAAHVDAPLRVRMALLFHDSGKPETAWVGKDGRKHYYEPSDAQWHAVCLADGLIHQGSFLGGSDTPAKPRDHEKAGETIWRTAANRLNAGRGLREEVATLIRNHMVPCTKVNRTKVRRERIRLGDDMLRDLYLMRMCDLTGKGQANLKHLEIVRDLEAERQTCQSEKIPAGVGDLAINGHDVIAMGYQGRDIGRVLGAILDEVALNPTDMKRSKEWQMGRATKVE